MLEAKHGVSAKNDAMKWWRSKNKRLLASMARLTLAEAYDAFDAMIASMCPSSEPAIETATANAVITIDETDSITRASIELSVGAMDSEVVATTGGGPTISVGIVLLPAGVLLQFVILSRVVLLQMGLLSTIQILL